MYFRRDELTRIARPPAKLNLFLDVFGRRGDGYHELETLMVPVRLWDGLSMAPLASHAGAPQGAIRFSVRSSFTGPGNSDPQAIPATSDNLVVRALELLRRRSGCELGADVELVKRIPAAAGLGGGSSDAAAALRLANLAWGLSWSQQRLATLAAEVGSDVPFFLFGGAAVCRGRGEVIEPIVGAAPLHFVLVKPPVDLSTADVYQAYAKRVAAGGERGRAASRIDALVVALRRGRLTDVGRLMRNSLQAAAATLTPWVDKAKAAFDELDFLAHQLSGSGSAYFGLCRHAQHARRLATVLRARRIGFVCALRSCP
jgi:4-diphosphocytidyl-2-C-methyl-D-erythritol kinase